MIPNFKKAKPLVLPLAICVCFSGCSDKLEKENQSLRSTSEAQTKEIADLKSKVTAQEMLIMKAEDARRVFEVEVQAANEKHRTETTELKDKMRDLQIELARREAELKTAAESTLASNAKAKLRDQKGNFETALTVLENLKKDGRDAAFSYGLDHTTEAFGLSSRGGAVKTLTDWNNKYRDAQSRVWDLTKVYIESEHAEKLSESFRSYYTEIGDAVDRAFKQPTFEKKPLDDHFKTLEERLKTLKEDVESFK